MCDYIDLEVPQQCEKEASVIYNKAEYCELHAFGLLSKSLSKRHANVKVELAREMNQKDFAMELFF